MGLDLQLSPLTVPFGTEFPPTVQALLTLIANYEEIIGGEDFSGVAFGPTEPDPADRDKPWFKTDVSGNPLGWFAWNGSAWVPIPSIVTAGGTADRPLNPEEGQTFFDSDIHVLLIYERGAWRTAAGSPGDVKEVKAATIEEAITNNPGWVQDTDSAGRFVLGVSSGTGFEYGDTGGEVTHTLTEAEMPAHVHTTRGNNLQADGNAANPVGIVGGVQQTGETGSTGGGEAHNTMPVYIAYWRILKE